MCICVCVCQLRCILHMQANCTNSQFKLVFYIDISPAATKIVADLTDFQDLSPMNTIDTVCCTDQYFLVFNFFLFLNLIMFKKKTPAKFGKNFQHLNN